jgi:4-amino-4-deoxy-L-arabinose transferase-like glycosyltransferase
MAKSNYKELNHSLSKNYTTYKNVFMMQYWKVCLPIGGILLVYIVGMFLDIMDIDAAQYASISLEMSKNNSFLEVLHRGEDYLDKPPLLFWVSALVFKLIGVNNFTYRIIPVLVCLIGIFSTYRLAKLYYQPKVAFLSALLCASSFSVFLMNHDVRTDTMLMGWTIYAIWQIAEYIALKQYKNLILGFLGIGLAMLSKGPIGLMVPVLAFSVHFMLTKQFRLFFRWQWLLGLFIIGLVLLPMCIGLYQQFDLQPEKVIEGQKNTSGLYFYFWKQSFGRLTGENVWQDDSDPFFFVHTYIWTVLPWGLLVFFAFYDLTKQVITSLFIKIDNTQYPMPHVQKEYLTFGGFLLPFIALSMSQYKLPHYINIIIPFSSIFTARYVFLILQNPQYQKFKKIIFGVQWANVIVVWLIGLLFATWVFPMQNVLAWTVVVLLLMYSFYIGLKGNTGFQRLILPSLSTIIGVFFILNIHFYPSLFDYQTGSVIGKYLSTQKDFPKENFVALHRISGDGKDIFIHTVDFYSGQIQPFYYDTKEMVEKLERNKKYIIYADSLGFGELKTYGNVNIFKTFDKYHVTQLTPTFLNPATRTQATNEVYLLEFELR